MKRIEFIRNVALKAGQDYNLELYDRAVELLAQAWELHLKRQGKDATTKLLRQCAHDLEFV